MLKIGIVGLPNAGKSTLFNALVEKPKAQVASHPFTTIDKNIGTVPVPDELLFKLASLENIGKVTQTSITFIDIAGLIKGAHQGEGLGNQFLHHIREVDLILHVVRFFEDSNVPHVHPQIDPDEDYQIVNEELMLSDLESLERRLKQEKKIEEEEKALIKKLIEEINQGKMVSEIALSDKEKEIVKKLNLLTAKKQVIVANVSEDEITTSSKEINGEEAIVIAAKFEAELNDLPWVEQQRILKDLGLKSTAKEKLIKTCYEKLDLITFYTIAKRTEARAWPIKKGARAIDAAEKIHSDFAKYFVKVEVIGAEELIKLGGWQKAKEAGKILLEGRDYLVGDKDVLEFKIGKS